MTMGCMIKTVFFREGSFFDDFAKFLGENYLTFSLDMVLYTSQATGRSAVW